LSARSLPLAPPDQESLAVDAVDEPVEDSVQVAAAAAADSPHRCERRATQSEPKR
jgi:hypothetical protein